MEARRENEGLKISSSLFPEVTWLVDCTILKKIEVMKKKQKAYEYVSVGMQIRTGDMIQLLKVFPAFAGHKFS